MTDLSAMTPVEVDTKLAEIWGKQEKLVGYIVSAEKSLTSPWRRENEKPGIEAEIASLRAKLALLKDEAQPFEAEYASRPWQRYFLVTNTNGHIHRSMHCSTCFPTTQFGWLIELADKPLAEMVEEFGEKACTVCFPDAPTLPAFHAPGRRDREAQEARAAEKATKAAEKAAKAITAPDGSPLRGGYGIIKTKVAAQRALSSAVQDFMWYGPNHPSDFLLQITTLRDALVAAGIDADPIIERAVKKGHKEGSKFELILKV